MRREVRRGGAQAAPAAEHAGPPQGKQQIRESNWEEGPRKCSGTMSWGGTFGAPAAKVAPNNFGAPPAFGAPAAAQFGGARPTQGFGAAPAAAVLKFHFLKRYSLIVSGGRDEVDAIRRITSRSHLGSSAEITRTAQRVKRAW